MCLKRFVAVTMIWIALVTVLVPAKAGAGTRISAVKGKQYRLDKRHGPWMIMVTNLRGKSEESRKNAAEQANDLIYELRKKGLPAYIYNQDGKLESVELRDRLGRNQKRAYASQRNQIAIMAGNFPSIDPNTKDGKKAQKTLAWVKRYRPKALKGAVYRPTPGKPNPFSRAMLVPNPMLSPEEMQRSKSNKLLKSLNQSGEYSLAENPGKFTLVVASFHGNSISLRDTPGSLNSSKVHIFDNNIKKKRNLDEAALNAFQLVQLMRTQKNIEAFVWHDRYKSVVTVGSFDSPNDPRIQQLAKRFRAKQKQYNGRTMLVAESIQSARNRNGAPSMNFPMDPQPELIRVPRF